MVRFNNNTVPHISEECTKALQSESSLYTVKQTSEGHYAKCSKGHYYNMPAAILTINFCVVMLTTNFVMTLINM